MTMKKNKCSLLYYTLSLLLAAATVYFNISVLIDLSHQVAHYFMVVLRWICLPMIFLSLLKASTQIESSKKTAHMVLMTVRYTIGTTLMATIMAVIIFTALGLWQHTPIVQTEHAVLATQDNLFNYCFMTTLIVSSLMACWVVRSQQSTKAYLQKILETPYQKCMSSIHGLLQLIPVMVWAFAVVVLLDVERLPIDTLSAYMSSIVIANLLQALCVLPLILVWHHIPVLKNAKKLLPSMTVAFWARSSTAALPATFACAQQANINRNTAAMVLPLCTTINMNACAAFIITTVLFSAVNHGVVLSWGDVLIWVMVATLAAVGNAAVPLGCYAMAAILLTHMQWSLYLLTAILPFYLILDMLESAVNVWSDFCITLIVDCKYKYL